MLNAHTRLAVAPRRISLDELAAMPLAIANQDHHGRRIDYLRISVTDRCNLRCVYCMPESGVALAPRDELLRFEEIWRVAAAARRLGFEKFRVTGGEPLVLKGALTLLQGLRQVIGDATLGVTTNGVLLEPMADDLKAIGIQGLNISLDTLDRQRFCALTRRDELPSVLRGLDKAIQVGFEHIKINAVIVRGCNEDDLGAIAGLAQDNPIDVRFIEQMPLDGHDDQGYLGAAEIVRRLRRIYPLEQVPPEDARAAAQLIYRSPRLRGRIGVIAPRSQKFCATCNRMRLTPTGELKGCLLSEGTLDLRAALRQGISDAQLAQMLRYAIGIKPLEYRNDSYGLDRAMSAIGG